MKKVGIYYIPVVLKYIPVLTEFLFLTTRSNQVTKAKVFSLIRNWIRWVPSKRSAVMPSSASFYNMIPKLNIPKGAPVNILRVQVVSQFQFTLYF